MDFSQRLEYVEEEGVDVDSDEGFRSITGLAFGLTSETQSQRLSFNASTNLALSLSGDSDSEFEDTLLSLDYARASRNSELTFGVSYRRDEVDDLVFDAGLLDDDLTTGDGTREIFGFSSGLVLGREGPITATFTQAFERSHFSDVDDPSLNDSETRAVTGRLSFQASPVLSTDAFFSWRELDEDGLTAIDRTTRRFGVGVGYDISPATSLAAAVFYDDTESRGATVTETSGIGYSLALANARPNGEIRLRFEQEETINGTRREGLIGRSYTLRRGTLSFDVGLTRTDGFSTETLANVAWDFALDPLSNIRLELDQTAAVNDDDSEVVNTRFDLSYTRDITSLSAISAGIELADENVIGTSIGDEQSVRFDLTHRYEMTRDWDLVSGFEYSSIDDEGSERRERSMLFVGVERSFGFRP